MSSSVPNHPRLYFTPKNIERFKGRIASDPAYQEAWQDILQRADKMLEETFIPLREIESEEGKRGDYKRASSQADNMAKTLGLAYRMTGKMDYATKVRDILLHYANLNYWSGNPNNDPPWHSELRTARLLFAYAVGYDSIYDILSDTDRKTIVNALVDRGLLPILNDWILPENRVHAIDSMGHNWWSVCVSMAGVATLAIVDEEPSAEDWLVHIRESYPEWFAYTGNILQNKSINFDAKGAFYESVLYADYALCEYLFYHIAHENIYGQGSLPDIPILERVGEFFIHTAYPTSDGLLPVNFGDTHPDLTGARTLRLLPAAGFDQPAYHWSLAKTKSSFGDPISLVTCTINTQGEPPLDWPKSILYEDIGWSMMRTSWEDNATMLAVKSGFAWNHAHPDAGSFILFHGGEQFIIDSGNSTYSRPEYRTYYKKSWAHNVVLIDGEAGHPESVGGPDRGVVHPGGLHNLMDSGGIRYLLADATGPTAWKFTRNYRHFLWIDDIILIFDDIRAHEEGELEWLLHTEGNVTLSGTDVHIVNGEAATLVRSLYPQGMDVAIKKGLKDHDPDTEVDYYAFKPEGKHDEMKFITAIFPLASVGASPTAKVELLEFDESIGVRIVGETETTDVFLNLRADGRRMHRNSNKVINGWDTDAYLFAITRSSDAEDAPETIRRLCVVGCSYLRRDGVSVFDTLSKADALIIRKDAELDISLHGQPIVNARIQSLEKPSKVRLNGNVIQGDWVDGVLRLRQEN